jgi:cation diffusion facilitator CzcD-associated flavoprotein CzcO
VANTPHHHRIAIVGSGFAGLGAAIRLKQAGVEDFVVLERTGDVGGTWNVNTYPGCQCDIPSHLYSFSFAPNPNWSRTYSPQPEIWEYLRGVCRDHGVDRHIRFHTEVTAARWDEQERLWRLEIRTNAGPGSPNGSGTTSADVNGLEATSAGGNGSGPASAAVNGSKTTSVGELTAELLIAAPGPLAEPKLPAIEGIETFAGAMFHSAEWNHEHSLLGKRVAAIGTGASAIQFVPRIQPEVSKLHVFQRTPPWVVPRRDRATTSAERLLYRRFPPAQRFVRGFVYATRELFVPTLMHPHPNSLAERAARKHLREQVPDPALRAQLTPRYRIGCKRVLISNEWYPTLQQPNVEVVTDSVVRITPQGVLTGDGTEREVDTIVFGTGFHVTDMPLAHWVHGPGGRSLNDVWQGSPQAYLGTTVAGFPNLFLMVGPNTGLGHNSIVFMIESQLNYIMGCLAQLDRTSSSTFEVRSDVQARFNAEIQKKLKGSVWTSGGCASWYLDEHGRNSTVWPGSTWTYRRRTRRFDPGDYRSSPRAPVPGHQPPRSTPPTIPAPAPA